MILCVFSLFWILAGLPFHNRIFFYLDLSLIILIASLLSSINAGVKYKIIINLGFVIIAGIFIINSLLNHPLINSNELEELKITSQTIKTGQFLAVSTDDAPWLFAYSQIPVSAPGMFGDTKTFEQWSNFWLQKNKEFLNTYPKPLYLYTRSFSLADSPIESCLKQKSRYIFEYAC